MSIGSWVASRGRTRDDMIHRSIGLAAAVLVVALIVLTGGEDSPFEFLLVPVLLHAAIACGRPWIVLEGAVVATLLTASYARTPGTSMTGALGDLGDVAMWVAAAVFVGWIRDRLHRNEERYRSLFEMHPDSVSSRDRWGTIEQMNPAASSLVGMDRDRLVEREWTDFVPAERLEEIKRHFVKALKGSPSSFETQLHHADGHLLDVAITFIPIVVEGEVIGVHHISQDITERVRAQSDLALFRRVVDQISDGVLLWDRETDEVRYANPAAAAILGLSRHELIGTGLVDLPGTNELSRGSDATPRGAEEGVRLEFDVRRRDGTTVPVESVTQRVTAPDGGTVSVAVLRDVSVHRETQAALEAALQTQEASTERLRSVNEMQNTFLQAVSHELRTPLTSITGYAQTLEQLWTDLPADRLAHMLGRLSFNAHRLSDMLQDLLDVDRLSRGTIQLTLTDTDLGALCREIVDHIEVTGRVIRVRTVGDVAAKVDRPKVERIVENLIYNATKHTPGDTTVWVHVRAQEDGVRISVEDDGPGVPLDLRDTIFEPFRQGPQSASSASPGTGIGLALVAKFTELHGGRAWVDDAPGGGAAFSVFLPSSPPLDVIEGLGVIADVR